MKPVSGKRFEEVWAYRFSESGYLFTVYFEKGDWQLVLDKDISHKEAQEICDKLNTKSDEVIKLRYFVEQINAKMNTLPCEDIAWYFQGFSHLAEQLLNEKK